MQIIGISAATMNAQPLNPVFFVKPAKPEAQATQSTTILLAESTDSNRSADAQSTFMYMASSSGGITIVEEMMFSSSFSATVGGDQSSSSFAESSSVFASSGAEISYASMSASNYSTGEQGVNLRFDALA
ncbi:MAG: hypothetical protein WAN35_16850 [Terracidiphilus sp.]